MILKHIIKCRWLSLNIIEARDYRSRTVSDTAKLIKRLGKKANAGWKCYFIERDNNVYDLQNTRNNLREEVGRLRRPSTTVDYILLRTSNLETYMIRYSNVNRLPPFFIVLLLPQKRNRFFQHLARYLCGKQNALYY